MKKLTDKEKAYYISKAIHWFHVIGVVSIITLIPYIWYEYLPLAPFALGFVLNLAHPEAKCYVTFMEQKYRKRAGLPEMSGWIKHYFIEGNIFRKD